MGRKTSIKLTINFNLYESINSFKRKRTVSIPLTLMAVLGDRCQDLCNEESMDFNESENF